MLTIEMRLEVLAARGVDVLALPGADINPSHSAIERRVQTCD